MSKTWRTGELANQIDMLGTPELSVSRIKSWGDSRDGPDLGKIPLLPSTDMTLGNYSGRRSAFGAKALSLAFSPWCYGACKMRRRGRSIPLKLLIGMSPMRCLTRDGNVS